MGQDHILNIVLDNLKKFLFPEEWIRLDLTVSKLELLALLIVYRSGEVIMSQIADYINAPLSTTTGLVNRLVKSGYLQRERSEEDRRIVAIHLTEKGKSLVQEVTGSVEYYLGRINAVLSDQERQTLFQVFQKIIDALNEQDLESGNGYARQEIRNIPIE